MCSLQQGGTEVLLMLHCIGDRKFKPFVTSFVQSMAALKPAFALGTAECDHT